jgi:hypothetical protein
MTEPESRPLAGRPRTFWLLLGAVTAVAAAGLLWDLGTWSWDVDEVESLQELHLRDTDNRWFADARSQYYRLPRAIPVWYACQSLVLSYLPVTEGNTRLLSAGCAILAVVVGYWWMASRHAPRFGFCFALVMGGSPLFLALAQQNRYYGMAVLFQVVASAALLSTPSRRGVAGVALSLGCSLLALLTHNLVLVYFGLGTVAALVCYWRGWLARSVPLGFLVTSLAGVALYLLYLRTALTRWNEFGEPRDTYTVLTSFASEMGMPTLALALLGAGACLLPQTDREFRWWALVALLTGLFLLAASHLIWFFNYRYALLFFLPFWVLAAKGVEVVGQRLGGRPAALAWYACVALLFLPKILSHHQDGSRKDFRAAAGVLAPLAHDGEPVYCNMDTTLRYYLTAAEVRPWKGERDLPARTCFVALSVNGWDAPLRIDGRVVELMATIGRRRFDEQAYLVRVYRVGQAPGPASAATTVP